MDRIKQLTEQLKAALTVAKDTAAGAEAAGRDFTDEERQLVAAKINEAGNIRKELEKAKADAAMRKTLADLGGDVDLTGPAPQRTPAGRVPAGKAVGTTFIDSPEYKELLALAPGGRFSKEQRIQSRPVGYEQILPPTRGQKALITGADDASGGAFVIPDQLGLQVGLGAFERPLVLRDLVTGGTTTSDTVEYVRVASTANNAAPVAEATTTANGTKPESGLTTVRITETVKTIAHWIPLTKRALADAAQVLTLVDNFLRYGLEEELEDQMVAGDGTGENFTGLANVSGVQTQAWDTDILTTLRKAKTKVRTIGRSVATGWVINPGDVEALDLLKDATGRYYFGGPSGGAATNGGLTAPLWNLPVIETQSVPPGEAYVGDWRKAILWDRQQASVTMSDSHANFFIQNLVAVLAELRAAFGILQPSAFVKIDLTP